MGDGEPVDGVGEVLRLLGELDRDELADRVFGEPDRFGEDGRLGRGRRGGLVLVAGVGWTMMGLLQLWTSGRLVGAVARHAFRCFCVGHGATRALEDSAHDIMSLVSGCPTPPGRACGKKGPFCRLEGPRNFFVATLPGHHTRPSGAGYLAAEPP